MMRNQNRSQLSEQNSVLIFTLILSSHGKIEMVNSNCKHRLFLLSRVKLDLSNPENRFLISQEYIQA